MVKGRGVTPVEQIAVRAPEAGRIRMGEKGPKGAPRSIDNFRLTSPRQDLIEQAARVYGGTARPWNDPRANPSNQFEVYITAPQIPVWLVPDGLDSQYELWSAGGRQRSCDGELCTLVVPAGDDYEEQTVPCICTAKGQVECKLHTRMVMILPELDFAGVWRLESKGWNAAQELPGIFDMIVALGSEGKIVKAVLSLERRERSIAGRKKNFVVPKLALADTALAIASGQASNLAIAAVGPSQLPALPPAQPDTPALGTGEREIVDAEVLDDELVELEDRLRADARQFGLDERRYVDAVSHQVGGDRVRMRACSDQVRAENIQPLGFQPNGQIQWKRRKA